MCKTIVIDLKNIEAYLESKQSIRLSEPYECYKGKIGVKTKYLISDRYNVAESLNLIKNNALTKRMLSKTMCERRLRRASKGQESLIEYASLQKDWRMAIIEKFGNPTELCKK